MVRIRLARIGRRKSPFYRVVVADSHKQRDGRFIEILGFYQPLGEETKIQVDQEKAIKWLMVGAQPSDTVRAVLRKAGVMKAFHEARKPAPKPAASA